MAQILVNIRLEKTLYRKILEEVEKKQTSINKEIVEKLNNSYSIKPNFERILLND